MDAERFKKDGLEALGLLDGPEMDITAESLGELSKAGVNRLVPFVGAGLSAVYDLPLWNRLLCRTAERLRSAGDNLPERIKELLDKNDYEGAAEVLQDSGGEAFEACLRAQLGRSAALIRGAMGRLPDLAPNLVLTTNLDRVLEFVFEISPGLTRDRVVYGTGIEKFKDGLRSFREIINRLCLKGAAEAEPPVIIKLHGDVFEPASRVLTKREYRKAYLVDDDDLEEIDGEKPLPWALERVYGRRTLLFLGCSLQNDRTAGVIKSIMSHPNNVGITHFALLEEPITPERRKARLDELEALHISPLFFPEGQYHRIEDFIAFLAKARDSRSSERKDSPYLLLSVSPLPESSRDSYNVKLENELGGIGALKRAQKMTLLENEHTSYKDSYEKQFRTFVYEAPNGSWLLTIMPEDNNWRYSPRGQEAFSATEADFVYELAQRGKHVIFFESGESMLSAIAGARKRAEWKQEWNNPIMVFNADSEEAVNGLIDHINTMAVPITERGDPVVIVTIAGPDKPVANLRRRLFNKFLSELHRDHERRPIRGENDSYYAAHREWLRTAHLRTANTVCLKAWHERLAYDEVKALCGMCDFENPRCRVLFLCGNDELALGALRAVREIAGAEEKFNELKKRVFFFGIDGLDRMTKLLSDEEIFGHTMKVNLTEMRDYVERAIKDPASFEGKRKLVGVQSWQRPPQ